MDTIISVVGGIALAVALFGGTLAAVFVAYSGILWMTAQGDPQKMAQARSALIGTLVGLIIVGVSFLIPPVVSELVIEPVGGVAIETLSAFDCDGHLKAQLVSRRWANNPVRMQRIINEIQVREDQCGLENWSPVIIEDEGTMAPGCFTTDEDGNPMVDDVLVPRSLRSAAVGGEPEISKRDASNNIIVYWSSDQGERPSDDATCWLYVSAFGSWREKYN